MYKILVSLLVITACRASGGIVRSKPVAPTAATLPQGWRALDVEEGVAFFAESETGQIFQVISLGEHNRDVLRDELRCRAWSERLSTSLVQTGKVLYSSVETGSCHATLRAAGMTANVYAQVHGTNAYAIACIGRDALPSFERECNEIVAWWRADPIVRPARFE